MPCRDITDRLELILDQNDCIIDYNLDKKNCRKIIKGKSHLFNDISGRSIDSIINNKPNILNFSDGKDELTEFLYLKHYYAIQKTLLAYKGQDIDSDIVEIVEINYERDSLKIIAFIKIKLLIKSIPPCNDCNTCQGNCFKN